MIKVVELVKVVVEIFRIWMRMVISVKFLTMFTRGTIKDLFFMENPLVDTFIEMHFL